jgi:hypothetical protein
VTNMLTQLQPVFKILPLSDRTSSGTEKKTVMVSIQNQTIVSLKSVYTIQYITFTEVHIIKIAQAPTKTT